MTEQAAVQAWDAFVECLDADVAVVLDRAATMADEGLLVKPAAGVLKHLPGRHDQSTHTPKRYAKGGGAHEIVVLRGAGTGGREGLGTFIGDTKVILDRTGDYEEAQRQAQRIAAVLEKVPPEYVDGIKRIDAHAGGFPPGSMTYVDGMDEIWIQDAGRTKEGADFEHSLMHEIGHRVQLKVDTHSFQEFEKAGYKKHFKPLLIASGNAEFIPNYKKDRHAGETFAESFAWYQTQPDELQSQFPELYTFWDGRIR